MFVGHAPSFQEFPFVLDENFPFDQESVFADPGVGQSDDNVQTLVSSARGATRDDQRGRAGDRDFRGVIGGNASSESGTGSLESKRKTVVRSAVMRSAGVEMLTLRHLSRRVRLTGRRPNPTHKKKHKGKHRTRGDSAADDQKKSKSSEDTKEHGGKKGKKNRDCSDLNALLKTTRVN